jgi:hypothetical protein
LEKSVPLVSQKGGGAKMWKLPQDRLKINLPPGFYLMEDEDKTYLFYGDKQIASFLSLDRDPKKIERVARDYLEESIRLT